MSEPDDRTRIAGMAAPETGTSPEFVGAVLNGIYDVRRFIARGGMGEVYEGSALNNVRDRVAIKIIRRELASDPNLQRMFKQEADTLMRLAHPGLVQYRVFARDPVLDVLYIVTEFVDGPTLASVLATQEFDNQSLLAFTERIASALAAAHELDRFHRDMCPDNVLLARGLLEQAKIIDFGIVKKTVQGNETFFTTQGGFVGHIGYAAPEQFDDDDIGARTDIYSMALTVLALAGRQPPDMGTSLLKAMKKRQSVPDLSPLPEIFRPLFSRMLAPEPADRPQSMAEVLTELGEIGRSIRPAPIQKPGLQASRADSLNRRAKVAEAETRRRKFPLLPVLGSAGLLAAAGAGAAFWFWPAAAPEPAAPAPVQAQAQSPLPALPVSAVPAAPSLPARDDVIQRVNTRLAGMSCRWVDPDYPNTGYPAAKMRVALSGVAGMPANLAAEIQRAAALPADHMLDVDTSKVWPVQPAACAVLDAISPFRNSTAGSAPLLQMEQPVFALGQPPDCPRGPLKQAEVKFTMNVGNPADDFSLITLLPDGRMLQLIPNRASFDQMRRRTTAIRNIDNNNYGMTLCTDEMAARDSPNGRFGLILLRGKGPFDLGLKPGDYAKAPDDLPKRFANLAGANGWRAEMAWYEVAAAPGAATGAASQ